MMIRAYSDIYVSEVRENLGTMLEYAKYELGADPNEFLALFVASGIAQEIECGNPKYMVGMSGIELARVVVEKSFGEYLENDDMEDTKYGAEYWGMWALTYYQWKTQIPYKKLLQYVEWEEIMKLYPTLHEADIQKFVEVMDIKIQYHCKNRETQLARIRRLRGYSQRILAEKSGVSLRMIQLYEQRQNDIQKAQVDSLLKLAKALECGVEDLLDVI